MEVDEDLEQRNVWFNNGDGMFIKGIVVSVPKRFKKYLKEVLITPIPDYDTSYKKQ